MAIDKALAGAGEVIEDESAVEIEIVNPEAVSIETAEGGMVIDFDPDMEDMIEHGSNLAEHLSESELGSIKSDLMGAFEADRAPARS